MTNPGTGRSPHAARKHDHHNPLAGGKLVPSKALAAAGEASSATFLRGDDMWAAIPSTTAAGADADIDSPIEKVNTVTASGAALTLVDVFDATMHDILLSDHCVITLPPPVKGKSFSVRVKQSSASSWSVTWDASAKWPGATAPVMSTAFSAVDTYWFVCFDGIRYEAGPGGKGHG